MNTYRITVAYDGTAYRGWQRQENTELTIQGILERRISEIAGKKTVVSGSGRTDSGVHALGQECSLYLEQEIDMDSFKKQLNALLPEDIRVLDISREKRDFHARKSAVGKCYEYQITIEEPKTSSKIPCCCVNTGSTEKSNRTPRWSSSPHICRE